ncbi:MAG: Trm112 family protein [Bifidobacteriaceae bacterium]|jgi:uncharacterized protein YbaR (Trm112 family)|nr:Trm112 family protein [Bifidobacteriaceae bacterium]
MMGWVRQALRCPRCKGPLEDGAAKLVCGACRLAYPFRDGIPAMLESRAEPLDGAVRAEGAL